MSERIFNQWDHLPINLPSAQIADPLEVLDDFFSSAWLPQHLEDLHKWRTAILEASFFVDAKGSPVSLYTVYKNNLKLVEAAYLINAAYKNGYYRYGQSIAKNAERLEREKQNWSHFPTLLNEAELLNPLVVLEAFFNGFSLQEYREQLEEWLESGLSNQSANNWMESSKMIAFYENLQKLYGAAFLIHQRMSGDPYLNDLAQSNDGKLKPARIQTPEPVVYKLNTIITTDQHEQLGQLVTIIKAKLPSVQAVFYLGVPPTGQATIYLLVLTNNNEQGLAQDISNHLEESCKKVASVFMLVHHSASLIRATDDKNVFLKKSSCFPVIYLSGGLILPKHNDADYFLIKEVAFRKWQRWHSQSQEFLKGAEYYLRIGAYNAALFSLNQTAECLLVAVVRFMTGYDINTHNLERLLKLTQIFTADIAAVFNLENEENRKLFNVLKGAYVDVRYRDNYESDPKAVLALYDLVKEMIVVLEVVHQKHLLASTL